MSSAPRRVGARPGPGPMGWLVAGLVLLGASGATPMAGADRVIGRLGDITVTATRLRPGPSGGWTSSLRITTSNPASDQLDAALVGGDTAAAVYHQQVNVGELADLASCGGDSPSPPVVDQWLHYGPLLVPGRMYGPSPPATATLGVPGTGLPPGGRVTVALYFAHAGRLTLDVPVRRT
jgi:hypothetical protein